MMGTNMQQSTSINGIISMLVWILRIHMFILRKYADICLLKEGYFMHVSI